MRYIDMKTWPRKEHFQFFSSLSFPFYCVTLPLDITALKVHTKKQGLSFYHAMIWTVTQAMNTIPDFKYKIRAGGIVLVDRLHASYVTIREESHLFQIVNLECSENTDLPTFCRLAAEAEAKITGYFPAAESELRDDFIYYSCTPWFSFTSMSHEMDCNPDDSTPRVTWGKYEEKDGRYILPFNVQFNHRLLDGWHLHLLIAEIMHIVSKLSED